MRIAKKLVGAGAEAGVADKWGVTCLMWACGFSGDEELVSMLIGLTAAAGMMGAAFPELPHYLNWTDLQKIADPGPKGQKTAFVLAWDRWHASKQGCSSSRCLSQRVLASLLAAQGLPLHAAVVLDSPPSNRFPNLTSAGDLAKLDEEALLCNGGSATAEGRDDFGRTALMLACYLGHKNAAERLAASAAAVGALEARDLEGRTAMDYARLSFTRAVQDALAARLYEAHGLPLHAAVAIGDAARVQALLQTAALGAATAQEPCERSTALAMACKLGYAAAAAELVSATATAGAVDAADSEGMTAMMHASMRDKDFRVVMEHLLQAGAQPDLADAWRGRNRCHLHISAPEKNSLGFIHQQDVFAFIESRCTCGSLMWACWTGEAWAVELLIRHIAAAGALDAEDDDCNTAEILIMRGKFQGRDDAERALETKAREKLRGLLLRAGAKVYERWFCMRCATPGEIGTVAPFLCSSTSKGQFGLPKATFQEWDSIRYRLRGSLHQLLPSIGWDITCCACAVETGWAEWRFRSRGCKQCKARRLRECRHCHIALFSAQWVVPLRGGFGERGSSLTLWPQGRTDRCSGDLVDPIAGVRRHAYSSTHGRNCCCLCAAAREGWDQFDQHGCLLCRARGQG